LPPGIFLGILEGKDLDMGQKSHKGIAPKHDVKQELFTRSTTKVVEPWCTGVSEDSFNNRKNFIRVTLTPTRKDQARNGKSYSTREGPNRQTMQSVSLEKQARRKASGKEGQRERARTQTGTSGIRIKRTDRL